MAYGTENRQNDLLQIGTVRNDGKVLSEQFLPEGSNADDKMLGGYGGYGGYGAYGGYGGYGAYGGYSGYGTNYLGTNVGGYPARGVGFRPRPIIRQQSQCYGFNCEKKCQHSAFLGGQVCDCWCPRM